DGGGHRMRWEREDHKHDARDVYGVAAEGHDHYDYADRHHRHFDLENQLDGLREDLNRALERIRELEAQTPQARQLQMEADLAAADLAESGYDRWPPEGADRHGPGCQCREGYVPEESPLARRDAYVGTRSNQDVNRRQ